MKRFADVVVALVLALPALAICLAVAPFIWLDSGASPVFAQWRVGRGQKPFRILKLRTMYANTANLASHEVGRDRITGLGARLRRLKFDELPQIWNVLAGDMSFIGPRPCLPSQTELIRERETRGVFTLRPGITGPAQIAGIDMSAPRELAEVDAAYCGAWSLRRDVQILLKTALGGGRGDAAASH